MQLCILTNCTCNIRQNSKKPMLISLNLIANPGDPNNRRKPLEIRNDPFPPVSSKVNLVNARDCSIAAIPNFRGPHRNINVTINGPHTCNVNVKLVLRY